MNWRAISVLLLVSLAAATPANAALLAYDPFDYAVGDLTGNSGGTGWSAAWAARTEMDVVAASLSYSKGEITASGGSAAAQITSLIGSAQDNVANRTFAPQTGDVYFSVLFKPAAGLDTNDFLQFIVNDDTDLHNAGSVGLRNSTENGFFARIRTSSADTNAKSNVQAVLGNTYLLVGKFFKSAGGSYDKMSVWVDPQTLAEPAASATVMSSSGSATVSYLTMRTSDMEVGDQFQFDELRIGTTWADVVPEPATLTLLALGAVVAALRGRRPCRAFPRAIH